MQKIKTWIIIQLFNTMIVNSKVGGRAGRIFNFGGVGFPLKTSRFGAAIF